MRASARPRPPWYQVRTLSLIVLVAACAAIFYAVREIGFKDQEVVWRAQGLKSSNPWMRAATLDELMTFAATPQQVATAWGFALEAVRDRHPEVRARALGLVASLARAPTARPEAPGEARRLLAALARDPDARVRVAAVMRYGQLGPLAPDATGPLREALEDPEPEVRRAAFAALMSGARSWEECLAGAHRALSDADPNVRAAAATQMSVSPGARPLDPETAAALAGMLRDRDAGVREAASQALERAPGLPAEAEPVLLAALTHADAQVAAAAARALLKLEAPSPKVVPALVRALEPPGPLPRLALRLQRWTEAHLPRLPPRSRIVPSPSAELVRVLVALAPAGVVEAALLRALDHPDDAFVAAAAAALAERAAPRVVVPALAEALRLGRTGVAPALVRALVASPDLAGQIAPALAEALDHPEHGVAQATAQVLIGAGVVVNDPALVAALARAARRWADLRNPTRGEVFRRALLRLVPDGAEGRQLRAELIEALRAGPPTARIRAAHVLGGGPEYPPEVRAALEAAARDPDPTLSAIAGQYLRQIQLVEKSRPKAPGVGSD
jgi:HEAT repeat protein